jgi:hypothetical protein
MRNVYKNLIGKPEGKKPRGKHGGRRRENRIKIELREVGWGGVD